MIEKREPKEIKGNMTLVSDFYIRHCRTHFIDAFCNIKGEYTLRMKEKKGVNNV